MSESVHPHCELRIYRLRVNSGRLCGAAVFCSPIGVDAGLALNAGSQPFRTVDGGFLSTRDKSWAESETRRFVDFFIDLDSRMKVAVSFSAVDSDGKHVPCSVSFHKTAPLTEKTASSYFREAGFIVRSNPPNGFSIRPASFFRHLALEFRYDAWLLSGQPSRRAKLAIPIRWATLLLRPVLLRRRTWILMDRLAVAGDNADAMFRYLVDHKKEIGCRPVFFLDRNSPNWKELRKIGPVKAYSGFRCRLATLFAEWTLSSQPHPDIIFKPLARVPDGYRGLANTHRFAFLQHGVILHDISDVIFREGLDFDLFVTTAVRERRSIVETPGYGYSPETVVLTGLPRHDRLKRNTEKIITFMPTWRQSLCSGKIRETGEYIVADGFETSDYVRHLREAVSSPILLDAAERLGYAIQFMPHPIFHPWAAKFAFDPRVRVLPPGTPYREIFSRSACCVTDWSSSIFDFVWLGKPVIYYQPENDLHYKRGYFDYERDGFGPVVHSADELVDRLVGMMERGCPMEEPYRSRAQTFFAFRDKENCRRVAEAVLAASSGPESTSPP